MNSHQCDQARGRWCAYQPSGRFALLNSSAGPFQVIADKELPVLYKSVGVLFEGLGYVVVL